MIKVTGLQKAMGGKPVLQGVDLSVAKGESCVIIGGSGAGKSVLIKCILGLLAPDAGQITIDGRPRSPAFMDRIGMLFQGGALFDSLPVWQNVAFKRLRGPQRAEARAHAITKLKDVGLNPDVADKYPSELSGGMQKRVGLARAIAEDPEVLFFDEPTTGLDPIMASTINALIRRIVTERGATAITITHDMTSVEAIADTVAMLHAGKVHWHGTREAMQAATDPHLTQFRAGSADGPIQPQW